MTLPLVAPRRRRCRTKRRIGLPILVGRENAFVKRLAERRHDRPRPAAARPGTRAGGRRRRWVGRTASSWPAATTPGRWRPRVQLAARVPRLWSMTGITLPAIERQAAEYLQRKGIAAAGASVVSLLVDAERRGIASIGVEVRVAAADGTRAATALGDLDAAHRQGREERTLNFSEAAATDVRLLAGGREVGPRGCPAGRAEWTDAHAARGSRRIPSRSESRPPAGCARPQARPGKALRPVHHVLARGLVRRRLRRPHPRPHRDIGGRRRRKRHARGRAHRGTAWAGNDRHQPARSRGGTTR